MITFPISYKSHRFPPEGEFQTGDQGRRSAFASGDCAVGGQGNAGKNWRKAASGAKHMIWMIFPVTARLRSRSAEVFLVSQAAGIWSSISLAEQHIAHIRVGQRISAVPTYSQEYHAVGKAVMFEGIAACHAQPQLLIGTQLQTRAELMQQNPLLDSTFCCDHIE